MSTTPRDSKPAPAATSPVALRDAAVGFAREAGSILLEGYGRAHTPERKGRIDLVTAYDRRSEALLLERIREQFPGHRVLAEESGAHEAAPSMADAARGIGDVRWIVDPLDGTTNFAHNYPFFCVSVAAEREGVVVAGAVYDPTRDEMFAAALDAGATLNGVLITVSGVERLEDSLLVTGFPYTVREHPETILPLFQAFLVRAQGVRRDGSAALNLCYVASGRFDGFWEAHLNAWDMAAGALIVREAGGRVSDYAGNELDLFDRRIVASNGRVHSAMIEWTSSLGPPVSSRHS